jgi:hypothetical protein
MNLDVHTVSIPGGQSAKKDRIICGQQNGVANAAGGSAGAAVVTAVAFPTNSLPPSYAVVVNPGQDATWWVDGKTQSGFNVHMLPRLAANTLAAGTFDVIVVA